MAHYYCRKTGETRYKVPAKSGKFRDTTIADARKHDFVPSVTMITAQLEKHFLTIYKIKETMEAAASWPFKGTCLESWKKEINQIAGQKTKVAQNRGVAVHDVLEQWFKREPIAPEFIPIALKATEEIERSTGVGLGDWLAEASFSRLGYGGKVDLHSKIGDGHILDFKIKNVDTLEKIKPYADYGMQLAAYRDGLGLENAKCYNLYINVNDNLEYVDHKLYTWDETELQRYSKMFHLLKEFWYLNNNIAPKWRHDLLQELVDEAQERGEYE